MWFVFDSDSDKYVLFVHKYKKQHHNKRDNVVWGQNSV